jgi:hypothetical protein
LRRLFAAAQDSRLRSGSCSDTRSARATPSRIQAVNEANMTVTESTGNIWMLEGPRD